MEDAHNSYSFLNALGCISNPVAEIENLQSLLSIHSIGKQEFDECESRAVEYAEQLRKRIAQGEEQVDSLLSRVSEIKHSTNKLRISLKNLRSLREDLRKQVSELESNGSSENEIFNAEFMSCNLSQLVETVRQFERLFGVVAKRTTSDTLQLFFHGCAMPANPKAVCTCQLRYTKLRCFEAVSCNPLVPDFERLVNHLNLTKDMRSFLIVLRHRFRRYFELASAVSKQLIS
ncbi:hypothetical protein D915_008776 [Fasciola hepatica]|uniref:Kinetochore protein SPC25 n=1 Tax=Fasciola hepatica TaxID=6192 RepID=A0A2H1BY77_FASHE|nr:hypothetical protein D915_008776 [Fasciola hepatica]